MEIYVVQPNDTVDSIAQFIHMRWQLARHF